MTNNQAALDSYPGGSGFDFQKQAILLLEGAVSRGEIHDVVATVWGSRDDRNGIDAFVWMTPTKVLKVDFAAKASNKVGYGVKSYSQADCIVSPAMFALLTKKRISLRQMLDGGCQMMALAKE